MENDPKNGPNPFNASPGSMPEAAGSLDGVIRTPQVGSLEGGQTDALSSPQQEVVVVYKQQQSRYRLLTLIGLGVLALLVIAAAIFIVIRRNNRAVPVQSGSFDTIHLPLGQIAKTTPSTLSISPAVGINGQLTVSKSIVLSPSLQPTTPTAGQIYYDKDTNQLKLYNGTEFINLGASVQTTSNVTNILGGGGGASLTATGGKAGVIPKFTGQQGLGASIITDNGNSVSISGNLNLTTPSTTIQPELKLWPENPVPDEIDSIDAAAVELGVKIRTDVSGFIKGIRFYKGPANTGTHTGNLWSSSGVSLASATFTSETASGWQEMRFATPIAISAETTYVASYHAPFGRYSFNANYFETGSRSNGSLHAPEDGEDGANGVFRYSATPAFPTTGFNGGNYWVDVIFQPNPPSSQYQVNGVPISSSDLSNNGDLAKRGASQVFTGNNTFKSSADSAASFAIQSSNGRSILQTDTLSERLYVGPPAGTDSGVVLLVLGNALSGGDPVGVEGAIYYNRERHMFRCYRLGAWGACADLEVESGFSLYDEFMGGQVSGFGTNGIIGSLGWTTVAIGANGSLSFNPSTPTPSADRPGVLALQTPAVANQGTTFLLGSAGAPSMLLQTSQTVKTAVAIGSTTNQVLRVGLHTQTSTTTQPLSGIWWEADPAASASWRFCYGDGTTATCANSTAALAANSWTRLEVRVNATGAGTSRMEFGVNGLFYNVNNATIDTTTRLSPAYSCYTTTAAAQNCYWDYFQVRGSTNADR